MCSNTPPSENRNAQALPEASLPSSASHTRGGAHLICVTSCEPSRDPGNMALNGAGESWVARAVAVGCGREFSPPRLHLLVPLSPRGRRFRLGASDRSRDEGAAGATGAAGSHLSSHGRLPAPWLPHAGRHVRGLRGEASDEDEARHWAGRPFLSSRCCGSCRSGSPVSVYFLVPRRSSSKINSGKSTAWLVRSSTQTWIKTIRL